MDPSVTNVSQKLTDQRGRVVLIDSNAPRHHRQAWMAFHKRRTTQANEDVVATPMSWPGCIRPAAGLRTLEAGYHRSVSTAQPALRSSIHGKHLPPIITDNQGTKGRQDTLATKDTGRRCRHKSKIPSEKKEISGFSARKWANQRSGQIHVDNINKNDTEISIIDNQEFKRAFPVPRQKRRENVVSLSEKEAASLRRLQGVYANTKERNLRAGRIQETMKALQDKTLHIEMNASLREYKKRVEVDNDNRKELKRVRDRYFKEKKLRTRYSHISLSALESPQVSRHAYGLPDEGKEFEDTHLAQQTELRLQEIWKKAVRRAIAIDRLINYAADLDPEPSLPRIKVKRSSPRKPKQHDEEESLDISKSANTDRSELIDATMAELDNVSSVGSDSDDGDLTDIGEED